MNRLFLLTLLGSLTVAPWLPAAAPPLQQEADQVDFLFLSNEGPVWLRLHVRAADQPYDTAWNGWMRRLFNWFDRDNNGWLSAAEAAHLPSAATLRVHLSGVVGRITTSPIRRLDIDTDGDGQITPGELKRYYQREGITSLHLTVDRQVAQQAEQINRLLFAQLGLKENDRLTVQAANRLESALRLFDENEDEVITQAEMNVVGGNNVGILAVAPAPIPTSDAQSVGLVRVHPSTESTVIDKALKNQYGKIVSLPDRPDLVLRLRLGSINQSSAFSGFSLFTPDRIEVYNPSRRAMRLAANTKRLNRQSLSLKLSDAELRWQVIEEFVLAASGAQDFYLNQFDMAAGDKNYVEKGVVAGLNPLFGAADRDGDNKLTRRELIDYLDLLTRGSDQLITMQIKDQGRNLFHLIDTDGDGRLSQRELRTVGNRLRSLGKEEQGLPLAELPRTLNLEVRQGTPRAVPSQILPVNAGTTSVFGPNLGGPVPEWFRKMDRNNDGDISPREWLGREAVFQAMDLDGDRLISAEEARRWQARQGQDRTKPSEDVERNDKR